MATQKINKNTARNIIIEVASSYEELDSTELAVRLARVLDHQATHIPYIEQIDAIMQRQLNSEHRINIGRILHTMRQDIEHNLVELLAQYRDENISPLSKKVTSFLMKYGISLEDMIHRFSFILEREPTEEELFKLDVLLRSINLPQVLKDETWDTLEVIRKSVEDLLTRVEKLELVANTVHKVSVEFETMSSEMKNIEYKLENVSYDYRHIISEMADSTSVNDVTRRYSRHVDEVLSSHYRIEGLLSQLFVEQQSLRKEIAALMARVEDGI